MLNQVEHEKSFITSGPDLGLVFAQTYLSQYKEFYGIKSHPSPALVNT